MTKSDDTRGITTDAGDIDATAAAEQLGEPVLATFRYEHLPRGPIREMSANFCALAVSIVTDTPRSAERTLALRELWAAKNYAVYAVSTALRGQPDEDGHTVGAERVREGSPETVQEEPRGVVACPSTHKLDVTKVTHCCMYEDDHAGRHSDGTVTW